jgi:hypothetical protein
MIKATTAVSSWWVYDTSRSQYNQVIDGLIPSSPVAQDSVNSALDILSNGFKLRWTGANLNSSGNSYIWAAFAENPFAFALAR